MAATSAGRISPSWSALAAAPALINGFLAGVETLVMRSFGTARPPGGRKTLSIVVGAMPQKWAQFSVRRFSVVVGGVFTPLEARLVRVIVGIARFCPSDARSRRPGRQRVVLAARLRQ